MTPAAETAPPASRRRRGGRLPTRLPLAFVVLAVPLAAAVWAATEFLAANETRGADTRLAAVVRAAAAQYVDAATRQERRAASVAAEPAVHRAFVEGDRSALARLASERPRTELALGEHAAPRRDLVLARAVDVVVGAEVVGTVVAWAPLDERFLTTLARRAGLDPDVQLAVALPRRGVVVPRRLAGAPRVPGPGEVADVELRAGDFRAAATALPGTGARLIALVPRSGVVAGERRARNTILVAGLVTLVSVAVIAYLLAPVLARARVGRLQREQAARVLDHVADGICLLDEEGVVRMWNPAAEAITGVSAARVLDRPAAEAIPGWARIEGVVPVAGTPGSAGSLGGSVTLPLDVHGREVWLSISGVRFSDGTVYAFRDLTEERRLEEMRADLVTTVSHELRTPLASIHGAAVTLRRRGTLDDDTREDLLAIIAEQSNRLARLADQILLASQLEAGHVPLDEQAVDAEELVREAVEAARTQAGGGPAVLLRIRARPYVRADPAKLMQVLASLLDNALKYSPPDRGAIEVRLDADGRRVKFVVRDEGIGIPAAEHERIFEKFFRLDPQLSRGVGGGGLGLYIARELVQRMGGRISVESEPGAGSTFVVELPVAAEPAASAA